MVRSRKQGVFFINGPLSSFTSERRGAKVGCNGSEQVQGLQNAVEFSNYRVNK